MDGAGQVLHTEVHFPSADDARELGMHRAVGRRALRQAIGFGVGRGGWDAALSEKAPREIRAPVLLHVGESERDHAAVLGREGSFAQHTVIGGAHIIPAVRELQIDHMVQFYLHIGEHAVGIGAAIEHVERHGAWMPIEIGDDLRQEFRAVHIHTEGPFPIEPLELVKDRSAEVPRAFHAERTFHHYAAATGQYTGVLHQGVRRAEAMSGGKAHVGERCQVVLQVDPRAHGSAVEGVGISAQSGNDGEVLALDGVFGEHTGHTLHPCETAVAEGFLVVIELVAEAGLQLIAPLPYQHLVHRAGVEALLHAGVVAASEERSGIVPACCEHDADALARIPLEDDALFSEDIHELVADIHHVRITGVDGMLGIVHAHGRLATTAFIVHIAHAELCHPTIGASHPAVHHVETARAGRIHEAVAVLVHVLLEDVAVQQQQVATVGACLLRQVDVGFRATLGIAVEVHEERRLGERVQQAEVDLASHRVRSINRGADALAQVDVLDPGAGYQREAVRGGEATDERQILQTDLRVLAIEPQHADGLGATDGIAVIHVHRGVGLEAFAEVATRGAFQFLLPDDLGGIDAARIELGAAHAFHHLCFAEFDGGVQFEGHRCCWCGVEAQRVRAIPHERSDERGRPLRWVL